MAADDVDAVVPALEAFDFRDQDADADNVLRHDPADADDEEDHLDDINCEPDDSFDYSDSSVELDQKSCANKLATIPSNLDIQFVPSPPDYGIKIVNTSSFGAVFINCIFTDLTIFEYCKFSNVVFEDVIFHKCHFSNTVFTNVKIIGDYWNDIRYNNHKFPEESKILEAPKPGSRIYHDVPPCDLDLRDPGRPPKVSELWIESAHQPQDISDRAWDEFDNPAEESKYIVDGFSIPAGLKLVDTRLISKFELSDVNSHNFFRGAIFKGCTLEDVIFEDCTLFGCVFENCHLKNVIFKGVALVQTAFRGCNLTGLFWQNKRYGAAEYKDETFASDDREQGEPNEILDRSHLLSARRLRPVLMESMEQSDGGESQGVGK